MLRRTYGAFLVANWRVIPEKTHYDLCVIGGGPAGIAAAMRAVDYKRKVCLIEKERLGGCDLWNGALQSKTMWEFAIFKQKLRSAAAQRVYGEPVDGYMTIDEDLMQRSMQRVSETRADQIRQALEATSVTLLTGQVTFQSNHEVQCHDRQKKCYQTITADYFIIATGSVPLEHPFVVTDRKLVVTSNEIMHQPLPRSLVVVGAGVIGCEFASILSGLGKTKVSVIDKASRILPREDADIVEKVERQLEANGVLIHHDSNLYDLQTWEESAEEAAQLHPKQPELRRSGVQYTIMSRKTKRLTTYNVDRALLCIGRTPNYRNLGLENTSLRTSDGQLLVDDVGRCAHSAHIFAVGDAAAGMKLVSMGEAQAKMVVDYIYGSQQRDTVMSSAAIARTMTSIAFLTKAVASVGVNETECRKRRLAYICCSYGFNLVSRAVAAANTDGFIKILVSNDAEMRMLGVRAMGMNASTMVDLGSLAIRNRQTVFDLADRLTAYPAISQAFQECLRAILGRSELKPGTFPSLVITRWSPSGFERGVAYHHEACPEPPEAPKTGEGATEVNPSCCSSEGAGPSSLAASPSPSAATSEPPSGPGTPRPAVDDDSSPLPGLFFRSLSP